MLQPAFVFRGHQAAVNSVCFFGGDRFLVSGDQDGHLIVWNMMLKRQLAKAASAHAAAILAVCGLGSDTVISQGRDNKLCVWRLEASEFTGDLHLVRSLHIDSLSFCKFTYSMSSWIAFLTDAGAGTACLLNVRSNEQRTLDIGLKSRTKSAGSRDDSPMCLKLVASDEQATGLSLLVGYESTTLQQFDVANEAAVCQRSVSTGHSEPIMSLDYDSQRRLVYTCSADNQVHCFAPGDGSTGFDQVATAKLKNPGCAEIRCFPQLVAVAGWDYAVHLFTSDLEPL
ncbi:Astra associated protein 1 Asa1, partial [Coemansia aciculifera]